jgi:hypothetical protein
VIAVTASGYKRDRMTVAIHYIAEIAVVLLFSLKLSGTKAHGHHIGIVGR